MNEPEAYEYLANLILIGLASLSLTGVIGWFLSRVLDIDRYPKKKKNEIPPYLKGPFK